MGAGARARVFVCAGGVATLAAACAQVDSVACTYGSPRSVGIDEPTAEGDTARALLARAAGPRSGSMRWNGSNPPFPQLQINPPVGTTVIDVAVTSTATAATYSPVIDHAAGTTCGSFLSVDVIARVVTADGAFDERWAVSLDNGTRVDGAHFQVDLRAQPLNGTFRVLDPDAASWDDTYLGFTADFMSGADASGTVFYGASRTRGGVHDGYSASIATWTARETGAADGGTDGTP